MGDEYTPEYPSIDSDEAIAIAKTDEEFFNATSNAKDLYIRYHYRPESNRWWIIYESSDPQYEGDVWIDCAEATIYW